ncbi:MAG: hypothetical protein WCD81_06725 [Candidatus Bathyarchaeia archaeon]
MNCSEIIKLRDEHNKEWKSEIEKEKEIGDQLRATKTLTKSQLEEIIPWKFDCDGRIRANELRLIKGINEQALKEKSTRVFNLDVDHDYERIELLRSFKKGIGVAVASVILAFYDPENYCVFDFHIYQELFGERPDYTTDEYVKLLTVLRKEAKKCGVFTRDIEKAYYRKNCQRS